MLCRAAVLLVLRSVAEETGLGDEARLSLTRRQCPQHRAPRSSSLGTGASFMRPCLSQGSGPGPTEEFVVNAHRSPAPWKGSPRCPGPRPPSGCADRGQPLPAACPGTLPDPGGPAQPLEPGPRSVPGQASRGSQPVHPGVTAAGPHLSAARSGMPTPRSPCARPSFAWRGDRTGHCSSTPPRSPRMLRCWELAQAMQRPPLSGCFTVSGGWNLQGP